MLLMLLLFWLSIRMIAVTSPSFLPLPPSVVCVAPAGVEDPCEAIVLLGGRSQGKPSSVAGQLLAQLWIARGENAKLIGGTLLQIKRKPRRQ
jgi:hypothetical protein